VTYVVAAKWIAREGEEQRVAAAISKLVDPSRAEPGCLVYRTHRDLDDPRVFFLYEEYTEQAAYEAHAESDHFRRHALEEGIPLLEARERSFYEPL
jgi:quinol monooxygenase YgiN